MHYFWEVFRDSRKAQEDEWSPPVTRLSKSPGDFFKLEFSFLTTTLKGTVSPDFEGFFMTYDIKSVLSAWVLMVFKFFHLT